MENVSFVLWVLLAPLVWFYLTKDVDKKVKDDSLLPFIMFIIYIWIATELFR
jgi:hypothetical protein